MTEEKKKAVDIHRMFYIKIDVIDSWDLAKDLAIIYIDGKIEAIESVFSHKLITLNKSYKFWQNVKKEIELI